MWQTDICTFRLAGKNAYLIGYIDDYSRYITGLGLFRSQTAELLGKVLQP
jgi:transposase InsO family protein